MLAQYKKNIMQITAYLPVMRKDLYYNPSTDYKESVISRIKKTNNFLENWKNNLSKGNEPVSKEDMQFISKFANIVWVEEIQGDVNNNIVVKEAVSFLNNLKEIENILDQRKRA